MTPIRILHLLNKLMGPKYGWLSAQCVETHVCRVSSNLVCCVHGQIPNCDTGIIYLRLGWVVGFETFSDY